MNLLDKLKSTNEHTVYFNKLDYDLLEEEHHASQYNQIKHNPFRPQVLDPQEQWRLISGYQGIYYVSNLGRVHKRSYSTLSRKSTLPVDITPKFKKNALEVTLTEPMSKLKTTILLSTLVGQAFVPNARNHNQFIHINGDPYDCRACNLKV